MSYTTIRFEEVKRGVTKKVPCTGCGKQIPRSITFAQTINPFNKTTDGAQKTRDQIWRELGEKCDQWAPEATCKPCRGWGAA